MNSCKNGLTLIEVLIALLIFTIGVMSVITLFPLSLQNVQVSQDLLIATELASSTIEFFNQPDSNIRAAILAARILRGFHPIKDINAGGRLIIPNTIEYYNLDDSFLIDRYMGYERLIVATELATDAIFTTRHQIMVTIRWNDPQGRAREFSTSSIIYVNKRVY